MNHAIRRMRPLLGTFVEIGTTRPICETSLFKSAFDKIEEIQTLLSFHDPYSDLNKLNYAQGQWIEMHPLSLRVLRLAKTMSCATQNLFNPTVGGQLQALGYLPNHNAIFNINENVLTIGTQEDIEISKNKARLRRPIRVVLDGIAKGYAVDLAIMVLKKEGLTNGWVNAGGDLRVFGDLVMPLQIRSAEGVESPLGGIQNCAVATTVVNKHFNPQFPGWVTSQINPPSLGVWTVLAKKAWRADALTKVASLALPQERAQIINRLGGRCL